MGQYHLPVNLDKREYLNPHYLGAGLKHWEQVDNKVMGAAILILIGGVGGRRGGGDLDDSYPLAQKIIGRWAGDRIMLVGDYQADDDAALIKGYNPETDPPLSMLYSLCGETSDEAPYTTAELNDKWRETVKKFGTFKDISPALAPILELELGIKYTTQNGWRDYKELKGAEWEKHFNGPGRNATPKLTAELRSLLG